MPHCIDDHTGQEEDQREGGVVGHLDPEAIGKQDIDTATCDNDVENRKRNIYRPRQEMELGGYGNLHCWYHEMRMGTGERE